MERTPKRRWTNRRTIVSASLAAALLTAGVIILLSSGERPPSNLRSDINFPATTEDEVARVKGRINPALTYDIVNANVNQYKNEVVRWPALIYTNHEQGKDGSLYLRARASESSKNDESYLVIYNDPTAAITNFSTYMVTGVVNGTVAGDTAYGESGRKVVIYASHIEEVAKQEAFHPTIESRNLTRSNSQNGFIVSLERIERARDETRLFLTVHNTSAHTVSMYEDSTLLVQSDNTQLERMFKYSAGNKRALLGTYPPGAKSSSQITYPAVVSLDDLSFYSIPPYTNTSNLDWYEIELAIK